MAEEIKFEKALERLSLIVEQLESGEVALDEAIKKYEEGVRLVRTCQEQLARAEQKIEVLTKSLDGTLETRPLGSEAVPEQTPAKSRKKTARRPETPLRDEELGL